MDEKENLISEEGQIDEEAWLPEASSDGNEGAADKNSESTTDTAANGSEAPMDGRLKFTARIDRSDREVELSAEELPEIYRKAVDHDRALARLAQLEKKLEAAGSGDSGGAKRDFHAEMDELLKLYPDAIASGSLPEEVRKAAVNGRNVTLAYMDYRLRRTEAENRALKQNAKIAGMAPVRGNGGAAVGGDDFLRGFDSED